MLQGQTAALPGPLTSHTVFELGLSPRAASDDLDLLTGPPAHSTPFRPAGARERHVTWQVSKSCPQSNCDSISKRCQLYRRLCSVQGKHM